MEGNSFRRGAMEAKKSKCFISENFRLPPVHCLARAWPLLHPPPTPTPQSNQLLAQIGSNVQTEVLWRQELGPNMLPPQPNQLRNPTPQPKGTSAI